MKAGPGMPKGYKFCAASAVKLGLASKKARTWKECDKFHMRYELKRRPDKMDRAMMEVLPIDTEDDEQLKRHLLRKKAFRMWLDAMTIEEFNVLNSLEETGKILNNIKPYILTKVINREPLSVSDIETLKELRHTLDTVLKYTKGERHVIAKFDFSAFRDETMKNNNMGNPEKG